MQPAVGGAARTASGTVVLTVTPNPSLDLLFDTESLVWDDANRMADPRRRAGGQGINVTRAVRALGGRSEAVALLGGRVGDEIEAMLAAEATPLHAVRSGGGETRTFVAVRESATGRSMLLNARGPARDAADAGALEAACLHALETLRPAWLACCGSLPAGFPRDFYARLVEAGRQAGARTVVDCDGEPLRLAVAAGCDLLVPNQHEAERLTGRSIRDLDDACAAARSLNGMGVDLAAVTLGAAGAVLCRAGECWRALPPRMAAGSAVGAGDAFLAGLLHALEAGTDLPDVLRRAAAAGSAVLLSTGAVLLDAADLESLAGRIEVGRVG